MQSTNKARLHCTTDLANDMLLLHMHLPQRCNFPP